MNPTTLQLILAWLSENSGGNAVLALFGLAIVLAAIGALLSWIHSLIMAVIAMPARAAELRNRGIELQIALAEKQLKLAQAATPKDDRWSGGQGAADGGPTATPEYGTGYQVQVLLLGMSEENGDA